MSKRKYEEIQVGDVYTCNYGDFKVIRKYKDSDNRDSFDIKFLKTESIKIGINAYRIRRGTNIKDDFAPSIHGVGYIGNISKPTKTYELSKLYKIWERVLSRCYNNQDKKYFQYGGIGVYVCKEWHNFEQFVMDVSMKDHYEEYISTQDWELDKDIICVEKGIEPRYYSDGTTKIVKVGVNSAESNKRMNKFNECNMRGVRYVDNKNTPKFEVIFTNNDKLEKSLRESFYIKDYSSYEEARNEAISKRLLWEDMYS